MSMDFDPLNHIEQSEVGSQIDESDRDRGHHHHQVPHSGQASTPDGPDLSSFHLTDAGMRITLNRVVRGKALLKLVCVGCSRTTHSPDTYIKSDWLEWAAGYYKLTPRMMLGFGWLCWWVVYKSVTVRSRP